MYYKFLRRVFRDYSTLGLAPTSSHLRLFAVRDESEKKTNFGITTTHPSSCDLHPTLSLLPSNILLSLNLRPQTCPSSRLAWALPLPPSSLVSLSPIPQHLRFLSSVLLDRLSFFETNINDLTGSSRPRSSAQI